GEGNAGPAGRAAGFRRETGRDPRPADGPVWDPCPAPSPPPGPPAASSAAACHRRACPDRPWLGARSLRLSASASPRDGAILTQRRALPRSTSLFGGATLGPPDDCIRP